MPFSHMECDLPCHPENVRVARHLLEAFLPALGFDLAECEDLSFALGEAVTNAITHGSPQGKADRFQLSACESDLGVCLEITDQGAVFSVENRLLPDDSDEHGRGLFLILALMDSVQVFATACGTVLVLTKTKDRSAPRFS